jgi:hypothetical protein
VKNLLRITIGGAVLTGSALMVLPQSAIGYGLTGDSLGTGQRDHRLYNNITASGANNNTTPDSNWPGYDGAEMAIWKAGAEWGARPFGTGLGDSTQTLVGDGGANFSFFWNGNASGVGSTNDNIHSQIDGSSGGVLAYCELPTSNGWRIRYYGSWSWQDGPGTVSSGICLQGVATHELGHSLGLDHTNTGGATMYPSISGTGTAQRSIETDDKNGVKAVYGTLNDTLMPRIDSVSGSLVPGGTVTINGAYFAASNLKVWLDYDLVDGGNAGGEPFKIENLTSTNGGTQISFTLPLSGGYTAGSIHVKDGNNNNHYSLSEGHPFDVTGGPITDSILLTASNYTPPVGSPIQFVFTGAPGLSPYILHYSFSNAGTTINGHPFDIGPPNGAVSSGNTDLLGGGIINRTVPASGSGRTVYMEVQADSGGSTFDSNMITIVVP